MLYVDYLFFGDFLLDKIKGIEYIKINERVRDVYYKGDRLY